MELLPDGSTAVTASELALLRQGLFMTLHHSESWASDDIQTLTGYELEEFSALMWDIDELSGHNDSVRRHLATELAKLAGLSPDARRERARHIDEVVSAAQRYGVEVPPDLTT